ncbi:glycosyltransferase [Microlunatus lacustris]
MRLLLLTAGSRGDVEPFVALAHEARRRGHQVRLGLPENSGVDLAELDAVTLGVDYAALVDRQGVSPLAAARTLRTTVRPLMRTLLLRAVRESLDFVPDVVVHHPKVLSAGLAAERLGVPRVVAEITPSVTATRAFPAPGVVDVDLGPLNRATYLAAAASVRMFAGELEEARRVAGLPAGRRTGPAQLTLVPVSRHLLPRPTDWPASVHLTGTWQQHRPEALVPQVAAFVARSPFLYAGFGSMAAGDPQRRAAVVVAAARARGLAVLLATGWGGLALPAALQGEDVLAVRAVPHAEVLPHAAVAVHHGGAGTVHATARAGTVSVVVPFLADQPFWGRVLHRAGLGPAPIPQRRLDRRRLGQALDDLDGYRPALRRTSTAIGQEDGAARACELLESLVSGPGR